MSIPAGHAQGVSLGAAAGPVFLPGSGSGADWQALLTVTFETQQPLGARVEAMYTGVPGADLVAFTGNLQWKFSRERATQVEPYLIGGIGAYVKFSETRFGLNGGIGVRRPVGPGRLFLEVRYHRVTGRFDEASEAATFLPLSLGIMLGH